MIVIIETNVMIKMIEIIELIERIERIEMVKMIYICSRKVTLFSIKALPKLKKKHDCLVALSTV